jgi:hypothetical protein
VTCTLAENIRATVELQRDGLDAELAQPAVEAAEHSRAARAGTARDLQHRTFAVGNHLHFAMSPERLIEVPELVVVAQPDSDHWQAFPLTTRKPEYSLLDATVFSLDKQPRF